MIVGLLGFISSGKGTAGEILINKGFTQLSFAGSLKDATSVIFGWERSLLEGDTNESREFRETVDKFWSSKFGFDITPRYILQQFGTNVCRNHMLDTIWVDSLERKIQQYNKVVITDVRFNNEIKYLKDLGSVLVEIDRKGSRPAWYDLLAEQEELASRSDIHPSEYEWYGNPLIDFKIENNSTKVDLEKNLLKVLDLV